MRKTRFIGNRSVVREESGAFTQLNTFEIAFKCFVCLVLATDLIRKTQGQGWQIRQRGETCEQDLQK